MFYGYELFVWTTILFRLLLWNVGCVDCGFCVVAASDFGFGCLSFACCVGVYFVCLTLCACCVVALDWFQIVGFVVYASEDCLLWVWC